MRYRHSRRSLLSCRRRLLKTITKVGGAAVVTGAAGFIGSSLARRLLGDDWTVIGIDSFDDFYHPVLKRSNVAPLEAEPRFTLLGVDIRDRPRLLQHLAENVTGDIDVVIHAATLAGVRHSALSPGDYYDVNVGGTAAMLELMRIRSIPHLVFVSSSSIYGVNPDVPWREDSLPQPISVYAATKLAGERLAARAAVESGFTVASARLFTVYGPGQRPDLAITNFAARMINDMPIQVFGGGSAVREFTYIDDVVSGLRTVMDYTDHSFQAFNLARADRWNCARSSTPSNGCSISTPRSIAGNRSAVTFIEPGGRSTGAVANSATGRRSPWRPVSKPPPLVPSGSRPDLSPAVEGRLMTAGAARSGS